MEKTIICENCGKEFFASHEAACEVEGEHFCSYDCATVSGYVPCQCCHTLFHPDDLTDTEDGGICDECLEEHYVKCVDCGDLVCAENATDIRGDYVCRDCLENDYEKCDGCGKYFQRDSEDAICTGLHYYCDSDCASRAGYVCCDDCGDWIRRENASYVEYCDRDVCDDCLARNYVRCDDCGDWIPNDIIVPARNGDYCPCCAPDHDNKIEGVHNYGYKPSPIFYKSEKDPEKGNLFFGVELEQSHDYISDCRNHYDLAQDRLNSGDPEELNFYAKEDSSLDYGLELVSHPRTLRSWLEFLPTMEAYFDDVKNCDPLNKDGLHIHISKRGMSECHKVRFGTFFATYKEQIKVIARRESSYSTYRDVPQSGKACKSLACNGVDRYEAVNWYNDSTVEIRIFRTTDDLEIFYTCLEFCHAAYQFTKIASIARLMNGNAWIDFLAYVRTDRRYSHLRDFLRDAYEAGESMNPDYFRQLIAKK